MKVKWASIRQYHLKCVMATLLIIACIMDGTSADSPQEIPPVTQKENANATERLTPVLETRTSVSDPVYASIIKDPCADIFSDYISAAGNFTHCELTNAKPFKLCTNCIVEYAMVSFIYQDLIKNTSLEECKIRYTKSDRVQIIPTLQDNIEALWSNANCHGCYSDLHINPVTREVNYTKPEYLLKFIELYHNFTKCIGQSMEMEYAPSFPLGNMSSLCKTCRDKYVKLNGHFESVTDIWERNVCMDMADMMNTTRHLWNSNMNCTHRTADSVPVIIITAIVASTPIFFYGALRVTGKVRRKRIFQQKRLASTNDTPNTSGSVSDGSTLGAGDSTMRPRLAPLT